MKFQFNIDLTDKDYTDFNVFCAAASVGFSAIFSVYNDSLMNLIFLPLRSYCTVFPSQVFSAKIKIRPRCSVSSIHCL